MTAAQACVVVRPTTAIHQRDGQAMIIVGEWRRRRGRPRRRARFREPEPAAGRNGRGVGER
jgi:hypothetical protein